MKPSRTSSASIRCLLVCCLLISMFGGCSSAPQTYCGASSTNPTYTDVAGCISAPTKVLASYCTEDTGLGNDSYIGGPQVIGNSIYTFSYAANEHICLTAWDRKTRGRRWSIDTNSELRTSMQPRPLASDGKRLFAVFVNSYIDEFSNDAVVCIDAATGKTVWNNVSLATPSYAFSVDGNCNIALHVDNATGIADKLYMVAHEARLDEHRIECDRNAGVWCLKAATGKFIGRFDLPVSSGWVRPCGLVCDAATLYVCAATTNEKPYASTFVGYSVDSGKKLWEENIPGMCDDNLRKQGNIIVFRYNDILSIWRTGTGIPMKLWAKELDTRISAGLYSDYAIDGLRLYLEGKGETVSAFGIETGKEMWNRGLNVHYQRHDADKYSRIENIEPAMDITSTRNVLYINDGGGMIHALDPASGEILWTKKFSQVEWHQTYTANQFIVDYGDDSVTIIMADGRVNVWK